MKMTPFKGLMAAGLLLASAAANAQFSSTWTAASEYDFRGVSQSAKDPALQGSVDYAFSNGFAVGAWASNVDYGPIDGDVELDLYASYTGAINDALSWTTGITYYAFPSSDIPDYPEIFVGLNYNQFSFKQWYTNDLFGTDESAWYTEANATFPLPANFSLLLHAGYSYGDAFDTFGEDLFDYSVGVGYALGKFNLALKYTGTNADDTKIEDDLFNNEGRVFFSVATTFPWKD
jgi:uncharacterized protein (TIGR02001 family)